MKKIIGLTSFLTLIASVVYTVPVLAQTSNSRQDTLDQLRAAGGANGAGFSNANNPTDPRTLAARIIRTVLGVIGTIFLVLTVYAGFLWMTAGGNDEQISKARRLILDGAMGLAVVLAAYSITVFVSRFLLDSTSGSSQPGQNIPDYCIENPFDPNCAG